MGLNRRHLLLLPAALALPARAATPPPEIAAGLPGAQLLGTGQLRFIGLLVYDARLWAPPGFDVGQWAASPLALELEYARSLGGQQIAERSLKEMQRQGELPAGRAEPWLADMQRLFPDVAAGDRLTGVHEPGVGARFYLNGAPRGVVADAEFSRWFFGIWLAQQTSEPRLRERLLGRGS